MRILLLLAAYCFFFMGTTYSQELPEVKKPKVEVDKDNLKIHKAGTSRFLLKLYGGYGAAAGNTYNYFTDRGDLSDNYVRTIVDSTNPGRSGVTIRENTKGLGSGARIGIGLAYIVNDYINLGVDVDYFRSTISRSRSDESVRTSGITTVQLSDFSYTADVYNISPHIVFKAISRNNMYVYTRLGATITPFYKLERLDKINIKITGPAGGLLKDSNTLKRYDVELKLPIGFFASFGANFKLSGRIRLLLEAQYTSIIFTPIKRTVVEFTENGVDKLNTRFPVTYLKQDVFTKEFTATRNPDLTKPREIPAVRIPVTNFSVTAGITYRF
jgi:hypothetical protein